MAQDRDPRDRRGSPRLRKLNLVHMSRYTEEGLRADLTAGRTLDISPGGMRLELHHPVPLRSVLSLTLALEDRIMEVSGEVDRIFSDMSRDEVLARATEIARERAVEAGADPSTLQVVEVEDLPLAYLPGHAVRARVRVVGDVANV